MNVRSALTVWCGTLTWSRVKGPLIGLSMCQCVFPMKSYMFIKPQWNISTEKEREGEFPPCHPIKPHRSQTIIYPLSLTAWGQTNRQKLRAESQAAQRRIQYNSNKDQIKYREWKVILNLANLSWVWPYPICLIAPCDTWPTFRELAFNSKAWISFLRLAWVVDKSNVWQVFCRFAVFTCEHLLESRLWSLKKHNSGQKKWNWRLKNTFRY